MAKRLKASERRASIIAVAKLLFADKGYHGVAVDEIARRLGVSPAILYQHFASKEELYHEVLAHLAGDRQTYIDAALAGSDDFASVLSRITHVFITHVAKDPDFLRMEMQSALQANSDIDLFIHNKWQAISDYIEYSVKELGQDEEGRLDAGFASLMYQGMLRELLYQKCILHNPRYVQLPLPSMADMAVQLFLSAIGYPHTGR